MHLRIFRREARVRVLGPGTRAVIWVQGCSFGCKGCIVPESWDPSGGDAVPASELAGWVLAQNRAVPNAIEGITLSGGEPFAQAGALIALLDGIRAEEDLGVVCYTGHTLERLQQSGSAEQRGLLERIDLLIDGVYRQDLHADLRWRGSSNQRLLALTDRYRDIVLEIDRSAGIEFMVDAEGAFGFAGVPAQPDFRSRFEARMAARGIGIP